MSHQDYIADRTRREPRLQAEIAAAEAELAVGELIVNRRREHGMSLAEIAEMSGITLSRLEAIEEGDALTLHELLWLLHALDLSVAFDQDFHILSHTSSVLGRATG